MTTRVLKDLTWLTGYLREAPTQMGDHEPKLKFRLPVFKARRKDSRCGLSAREAWRVLYAVDKKLAVVHLFFIVHKKVVANPGPVFMGQKLDRAF